MAENNEHNIDALRSELNSLRNQLEGMVKNLETKHHEVCGEVHAKIADELEHYRKLANKHAQKVYDAGQAGIEEVGSHVRENPLASLLIAFGVGCVVSSLLRQMK